jgi:hypothetical protein
MFHYNVDLQCLITDNEKAEEKKSSCPTDIHDFILLLASSLST